MPLTEEQKKAKIAECKQKVRDLKIQTFERWCYLAEADERIRKCSGYSKGADDMLQKLAEDYRKEHTKLLKPFDRGDYD